MMRCELIFINSFSRIWLVFHLLFKCWAFLFVALTLMIILVKWILFVHFENSVYFFLIRFPHINSAYWASLFNITFLFQNSILFFNLLFFMFLGFKLFIFMIWKKFRWFILLFNILSNERLCVIQLFVKNVLRIIFFKIGRFLVWKRWYLLLFIFNSFLEN